MDSISQKNGQNCDIDFYITKKAQNLVYDIAYNWHG